MAASSLFSSRRSKFKRSHASFLLLTMEYLRDGIPISTGITAYVSYPGLYAFSQAHVCSFYKAIALRVLNGSKVLGYIQFLTPCFEWNLFELLFIVGDYFSRYSLIGVIHVSPSSSTIVITDADVVNAEVLQPS
ncbi:hypothetical protein Tco_1424016 [Tanacetum coccineum]